MHSTRVILAFFALLLTLSACAAPSPTTAPTATVAVSTNTPAPTRTPLPTETPRPTITPTVTETPLPTFTFTPTPDSALAEATLLGMAWLEDYNLLLSFGFPGPVDPEQYQVTLEDKVYECEVLAQYPNRLYCYGQGAKVLGTANVRVYPKGSLQPGFEKDLWIPYFDNNYSTIPQ
jgi:hypothetical protein